MQTVPVPKSLGLHDTLDTSKRHHLSQKILHQYHFFCFYLRAWYDVSEDFVLFPGKPLVLHTRCCDYLCRSLPQFFVVRLRTLFFLSREIVISLYHAIIGYLQLGQEEPSAYLPKEHALMASFFSFLIYSMLAKSKVYFQHLVWCNPHKYTCVKTLDKRWLWLSTVRGSCMKVHCTPGCNFRC